MGPISVVSKTETMIELAWSEVSGVATGNSVITAYKLYWDDNSGSTDIMLTYGATTVTYTVFGTTGGLEYKFKVTASNIYGEGEASDELSQIASDVPDQLEIIQTSISGTVVIFDWTAPHDNHKAILEYDIIFLSATGAYLNEPTYCDG